MSATLTKKSSTNRKGSGAQAKDEAIDSERYTELSNLLQAIGASQAVIEFDMDGTIQTANDNFLNAVGYSLDEITGQHHSLFVDESYRNSSEYRDFWARLNRGENLIGEYKRIAKNGKALYLQASYNPIADEEGNLVKVVKFATDITSMVEGRSEANRVQSMMDQAPINVMFADTDFVIQYVNPASVKTLKGLEHLLPIKADQLLGQCIDIFHKDPQHQRRLLSDPQQPTPSNQHPSWPRDA